MKRVEDWMIAQGIRQITRNSKTGEWSVQLTCAGPCGYDSTLAKALGRAREANADWFEQPEAA